MPQPPSLAARGPSLRADVDDLAPIATMHGGPAPSLASMTVMGSHVLDEDLFGDLFETTAHERADEGSATSMGHGPAHTSFGQTVVGTRVASAAPTPLEDAWLDDVSTFLREDTESEALRPLLPPPGHDPNLPSVDPARAAAAPTGPQTAIAGRLTSAEEHLAAATAPQASASTLIGAASGILRRPGKRSRQQPPANGAMASAGTYLGGTATGPHGAVRAPSTGGHAPVRHTPGPMTPSTGRPTATPAPTPGPRQPVAAQAPQPTPPRPRPPAPVAPHGAEGPREKALRDLATADTGAMPAIDGRDEDPFAVLRPRAASAPATAVADKLIPAGVGPATAASPAFSSADTVPHDSAFDPDTRDALRALQQEVRDAHVKGTPAAGQTRAPAPQVQEATPGQFTAQRARSAESPAPTPSAPTPSAPQPSAPQPSASLSAPAEPTAQEPSPQDDFTPAEHQALEAATRAAQTPARQVRFAVIAIVVGCVLAGVGLLTAVFIWVN